MTEIESVGRSESALCHREVVYGIEKIRLALAVISTYTVDIWRELQFLKLNISEVRYDDFFEYWHIPYDILANIINSFDFSVHSIIDLK